MVSEEVDVVGRVGDDQPERLACFGVAGAFVTAARATRRPRSEERGPAVIRKRTEPQPRPSPAADLRSFPTKLDLTCSECATTAKYAVGAVLLDPAASHRPIEERVCFMACFRCKQCDAIGPWEIPGPTETMILLHATFAAAGEGDGPVLLGRPQLFDGTVARSGEQAVAHLRGLIAEDPESVFLWSRLGNTYRRADELEDATASYRRALEIDPTDIESAHSLAEILEESGAPAQEVARLYRLVTEHAWQKKGSTPDQLLRGCVRSALESLFELHEATDGEIEIFAERKLDASAIPAKAAAVEVRTFELSSEESWDDFVSDVLREPRKHFAASRGGGHYPRKRPRGLRRTNTRCSLPTRNGPCPCGSGRKYKNCCARSPR